MATEDEKLRRIGQKLINDLHASHAVMIYVKTNNEMVMTIDHLRSHSPEQSTHVLRQLLDLANQQMQRGSATPRQNKKAIAQ